MGRHDEAIQHLEKGIQLRIGESELVRDSEFEEDWAFLAMAHHHLGHHDEARRWLDRLRSGQPIASPARSLKGREIQSLRIEVEAVIIYDSDFPSDPFVL